MPKNIKRFIPIIVILAIIAVSAYYYLNVIAVDETGALNASGTVETTEVTIAPEVGGRIVEVLAAEGDLVQSGDILFTLDDELLQAQRGRAEAGLEAAEANLGVVIASRVSAQAAISTAQAQYDLAVYAARFAELPGRVAAWGEDRPDEFEQPIWYFEKSEQLVSAETEVQAAEEALKVERANFERVIQDASNADVVEAEARLSDAQAAFLVAQDVLTRAQAQGDEQLETHAQDQFDSTKAELEAAQSAYTQMLSDTAASDVLEARARLAVARERYETSLDRWNQLLTGKESLQVKAAQTVWQQAEANAAQIEASITQAEKAIAQAQTELDLLDVQMEKLVIRVSVAGVVLSRNIEPGEVIKPGGTAMTLGQLDELSITVYVPEDRYGEIRLGDKVDVTVDSFPGETFSATVVRIADKAEFTPRNVQTPEGRRTTVFAVELAVSDPDGKLKPGMPADVELGIGN
ncbi:MAG: HlyD family efflux transporter periplasmic adaptor subunit [Chloroflexi bacterium]|nr:HlyD family efflux transporter periplasmic adaptor subunit [Chloroflexota bacterium]MBU1661332.1 HlyD family efflux transporter periplasmic adaptor subunit [Chloroflexota bacterium]